MADIITAPQITQLVTELSNMLAITREQANFLIQNALQNGQLVFAVPFNTDSMDLEVARGSSQLVAFGLAKGTASQTLFSGVQSANAGVTITTGTGVQLKAVTTGKKFYLSYFSIGRNTAGDFAWVLTDNGQAGTRKVGGQIEGLKGGRQTFFPIPIEFSTDIFLDTDTTGTNWFWAYVGWEE